jgi:cell division protein FtsB
MKFGKKNSYKTYLYSRPTVAILVVIALLLFTSVFERFVVERDMIARRDASEVELERLQARKIQLEDRVQYLEGERGIEEEIRKNFDVAREGEQVIVLTGEEPVLDTVDSEIVVNYPWYQFWR